MVELNEPVLEDDYPIYGNYLYVCDGITVRQLKLRENFTEVRRCDIVSRQRLQNS